MGIKTFILFIVLVVSGQSFSAGAATESSRYLDVLTKKTIEDFQKGIELYNSSRASGIPQIKKAGGQRYRFKARSAEVSFSIVNYLSNEMYIDDKIYDISTFGLKKTSWMNLIIQDVHAGAEDVDAETTKVILTALGGLSGKLESVGMMCFSGCQKETRLKNLSKIMTTLDVQKAECEEQKDAQEDSIKKFPTLMMVSFLHSTLSPEFQNVRKFMQKIAEASTKSVNEFMETKLASEKKHQTCIGVMTAGTVADGSDGDFSRGIMALKSRSGGMALEQAVNEATNVCIKIDQVKSCLLELKKNIAAMNTLRRNSKTTTGERFPAEEMPNLKSIER